MERNWEQKNAHRGADGKSTAIEPKATIALIDDPTFRLLITFNAKNIKLNARARCSNYACIHSITVCWLVLTKYHIMLCVRTCACVLVQ